MRPRKGRIYAAAAAAAAAAEGSGPACLCQCLFPLFPHTQTRHVSSQIIIVVIVSDHFVLIAGLYVGTALCTIILLYFVIIGLLQSHNIFSTLISSVGGDYIPPIHHHWHVYHGCTIAFSFVLHSYSTITTLTYALSLFSKLIQPLLQPF